MTQIHRVVRVGPRWVATPIPSVAHDLPPIQELVDKSNLVILTNDLGEISMFLEGEVVIGVDK